MTDVGVDEKAIFIRTENGIKFRVKARAGRNKARAIRLIDVGEGARALEVTVNAPPEDGKANKAIAEALAKCFGVKSGVVFLTSGATGKIKMFEIIGDGDRLLQTAFSNFVSAPSVS